MERIEVRPDPYGEWFNVSLCDDEGEVFCYFSSGNRDRAVEKGRSIAKHLDLEMVELNEAGQVVKP